MLMSVEIDQFYKVNIIGYMTFSCQAGIDNYHFRHCPSTYFPREFYNMSHLIELGCTFYEDISNNGMFINQYKRFKNLKNLKKLYCSTESFNMVEYYCPKICKQLIRY